MAQSVSFVPRVAMDHDGSVMLYGYQTPGVAWQDGPQVGARINADSRCTHCGEPFLAGHAVTADLAPGMSGTARHTNCDDPKLERQDEQ